MICTLAFADARAGLAFILSHNPLQGEAGFSPVRGAGLDVTNEAVLGGMLLIRAYQLFLSPHIGQSCNFHPSCSQYAIEAVKKYGFALGVLMASDRLGRCNGRSLGFYPLHVQSGKRFDPPERNAP